MKLRLRSLLIIGTLVCFLVFTGCSTVPKKRQISSLANFCEPWVESPLWILDWSTVRAQDHFGRFGYSYDDSETFDFGLQRDVDKLRFFYPLTSENRISFYATGIAQLLRTSKYITADDYAYMAIVFSGDMVAIHYNANLKDGGVFVIVDATNGRIAYMCDGWGKPIPPS